MIRQNRVERGECVCKPREAAEKLMLQVGGRGCGQEFVRVTRQKRQMGE